MTGYFGEIFDFCASPHHRQLAHPTPPPRQLHAAEESGFIWPITNLSFGRQLGVVFYDGETSAGFGEGLYAVPIRALWEMT